MLPQIDEATARAKTLYGPDAFVWHNTTNGMIDILIPQTDKINLLVGWGWTIEEAFECAAQRYS